MWSRMKPRPSITSAITAEKACVFTLDSALSVGADAKDAAVCVATRRACRLPRSFEAHIFPVVEKDISTVEEPQIPLSACSVVMWQGEERESLRVTYTMKPGFSASRPQLTRQTRWSTLGKGLGGGKPLPCQSPGLGLVEEGAYQIPESLTQNEVI